MKNSNKQQQLTSILSQALSSILLTDLQKIIVEYLSIDAQQEAKELLKNQDILKWFKLQPEDPFVDTLHDVLKAISKSKPYQLPFQPNAMDYHQTSAGRAHYDADMVEYKQKCLLTNKQCYDNPIEALQELATIKDDKGKPYYFTLSKSFSEKEEDRAQQQLFDVFVLIADVDINVLHITRNLGKLLYFHMLDLNLKYLTDADKDKAKFNKLSAGAQLASRVADWKSMGITSQFIEFKGTDGYWGLFTNSEAKVIIDIERHQETRQKDKSRRLTSEEQKILQDTIGLFLVRNPVPLIDLSGVKKQRHYCQAFLGFIHNQSIGSIINEIRKLQIPGENNPFQKCLKVLLKDLESFLPKQATLSLGLS